MRPMVIEYLAPAAHSREDFSDRYEFSENLLKNIAILITIEDEAFRRRVLSGEKELKKTMFRLRMRSWFEPLNRTRLSIIIMPSM